MLGGLDSSPPAFANRFRSCRNPAIDLFQRRSVACVIIWRRPCGLAGRGPGVAARYWLQGLQLQSELGSGRRGDGANWQSDEFREHRDVFRGYQRDRNGAITRALLSWHRRRRDGDRPDDWSHATGVLVIDMTNSRHRRQLRISPRYQCFDPWESLKVNTPCQLLGADNAHNGGGGKAVQKSTSTTSPWTALHLQISRSVAAGTGTDGGVPSPTFPERPRRPVEAPDGLTYYRGDSRNAMYHAIDTFGIRRGRKRSQLSTLRQRCHYRS